MSFLNANLGITVVMLAQGIKETSPEILEYRKSLQKKPTITASIAMDKGKAKMESDSPTLGHDLITHLKKEKAMSSSTTKNGMPQGDYQ